MDGSVVTWGQSDYGGDSSRIQRQLKNVQQLEATSAVFAAVLAADFFSPGVIQLMVATILECKVISSSSQN
jgi:hypothetical protein